MKTKTILMIIIAFLIMPLGASAIPFNNFSTTTGGVSNGNGYFSNETSITNTDTNRNIYLTTEPTKITLVEPIGYAQGSSNAYDLILKGDSNLIYGVVASDGYIYFIDSSGIKKKRTKDSTAPITANSTADMILLVSGTFNKIVDYNGAIYYMDSTTLKSIASPDYQVQTVMTGITAGNDFTLTTISGTFTVITNVPLAAYAPVCGSNACASMQIMSSNASVKNNVVYHQESANVGAGGGVVDSNGTILTTSNYIYTNAYVHIFSSGLDRYTFAEVVLYKNYTVHSTNFYAGYLQYCSRCVSLGGYSTISMYSKTQLVYDTFNFAEAGILSVAPSPVSGNVFYNANTISVPAPTYYNNSVIPMDYDVRFYITVDNFTAFSNLMSWSIIVTDPSLVQTTIVNDLSFSCVQTLPWWDTFGFFRVISFGTITGDSPYACDAVSSINYAPSPGTFWPSGGFSVGLYEDYLTNHALLGSDTWNVINQSNNVSTIITKPSPGGGINGGNPMKEQTDNFLSGGMFVALIMVFLFAGAGQMIGGFMGASIGFGGGFIFASIFGLIPTWALFLFAILVITLFAIMVASKVVGGGEGGD